jgi:hypothetical protein
MARKATIKTRNELFDILARLGGMSFPKGHKLETAAREFADEGLAQLAENEGWVAVRRGF